MRGLIPLIVLLGACDGTDERPLAEVCPEQTSREDCEAVPQDGNDHCYWESWVPVEIIDASCVFSEPTEGACRHESMPGEFCGTRVDCIGTVGRSRDGNSGTTELSAQDVCVAVSGEHCMLGSDGAVVTGVPECACLCDPAFPL